MWPFAGSVAKISYGAEPGLAAANAAGAGFSHADINPIKQIYRFNQQAGLLDDGYDDFLESAFQVEEALEGFDLALLADQLFPVDQCEDPDAKFLSRHIAKMADAHKMTLSDVERLDKACDAIVYAIGSIAKLGLDHHGVTKALNIVNNANKAKLSMPRDEYGKLLKPADFQGPEPELQKLLDTRK